MNALNVTEPFILGEDVLLVPCAELGDDLRGRISFDEGDFTLSRRRGRTKSQVIDGQTAALLALFREPRTIASAIIENSRAIGKDPRARLEELLPHLGTFVKNEVLVPAGSEAAKEIRPSYENGATVAGWEIVRCVSLVDDSEIYEVRNGRDAAALKIARTTTSEIRTLFRNELAVLRHLDGDAIAPRLIDAGVHEKRPYLLLEWIDGVDAVVAAARRRHDRASLIELCASIAGAYAALHARGVLHGDVHARNVLVGDKVVLLDFGYSRLAGLRSRTGRAGVQFFFEPELLGAQRRGVSRPPSAAGEQYALAALLYLLIAGSHYLDFRLDREEMERQMERDAPVPFATRGIPPWPEVEQILFRALEKKPARRFASIAEMAAALAEVRDTAVREATPLSPQAHALLETTLQSFARGGAMFSAPYPPPQCGSITLGCAGAAIGLLRMAEARGDPALLALADVWRSRAAALIGTNGGYDRGVTPYLTESGGHAVAAMIASAQGDSWAQQRALDGFIVASKTPWPELDLTLGRSGSLLAAAMLLAISDELPEAAALRAFGAETMGAIWSELDARPPLDQSTNLSMAHGWAGYLYAAMRWCLASADALPPRLLERLREHAALPRTADSNWCRGSAGQLYLFTLAHRLLGGEQWLRLAEQCAWTTWKAPRGVASLCCGSAGRAYALLHFYRHTGSPAWLGRARDLANHAAADAAATAQRPNSLWQGELGVAVLVADLASPENARTPFFE